MGVAWTSALAPTLCEWATTSSLRRGLVLLGPLLEDLELFAELPLFRASFTLLAGLSVEGFLALPVPGLLAVLLVERPRVRKFDRAAGCSSLAHSSCGLPGATTSSHLRNRFVAAFSSMSAMRLSVPSFVPTEGRDISGLFYRGAAGASGGRAARQLAA